MPDLIAEVMQLRGQVEKLRDEQARAEAWVAASEEEEARLLKTLLSDFGVSTLEDAQKLLTILDVKIVAEMEAARAQLAQTGGL